MHTSAPTYPYKHHRFPAESISHGVWLYDRFCLSYRDVEELLFARGVIVTYEAIRKWCRKFGQAYANQLRRRRPKPGDKWHLDEVFLTIHGARHDLWRAVDQDGHGLDILGQHRRDKHAANKCFHKIIARLDVCATGAHHGHVGDLWRREAGGVAQCRTSATAVSEPSCRKLAPADAPAG
jgi:putative transposase